MRTARTLAALLVLSVIARAQAPCSPSFTNDMGPAGVSPTHSIVHFDDGSGDALYIASSIVGTSSPQLYRWNGATLAPVFGALPCHDARLLVHDDGNGDALYATGQAAPFQSFHGVWRWNGGAWAQLGGAFDGDVFALATYVDPTTSQRLLLAGGSFTTIGGVATPNLAAWDGAHWSTFGGGAVGGVYDLVQEIGGALAGLYADGPFAQIGGVTTSAHVARFDGTVWTPIGPGDAFSPGALALHDDGSGRKLYRSETGFPRMRRWDGASWSTVGSGFPGVAVQALTTFDDGAGARLYATGFAIPDGALGATQLARWNGSAWSVVATMNHVASALCVFDEGSGPRLFVGGGFSSSGGRTVHGVGRWNGSAIEPLVEGGGLSNGAWRFARFDDGSGPAVYCAGASHAGGADDFGVARWRVDHWESVGGSFASQVLGLAALDVGNGPVLYAGGAEAPSTAAVSRWNGSAWIPVGTNLSGRAREFVVHDEGVGPRLFACGVFRLNGGPMIHAVVRFNGTNWTPVGGAFDSTVLTLAVHDDGNGPTLFAGGEFLGNTVGTAHYVARWNGAQWQTPGAPLDGSVFSLLAFDEHRGAGTQLYAGGLFTNLAQRVARWDGSAWHALGSGVGQGVYVLGAHDAGDGQGEQLYAGGYFSADFAHLARWNGNSWSTLGTGLSSDVFALASLDGGQGRELWIGGDFTLAGGLPSIGVARWHGCTTPGTSFCSADGSDPLVTTLCPCGNTGAPGHGCAHSQDANGALLLASGTTSPDSVHLDATQMPGTATCIFLKGDQAAHAGIVFGDGVRCIDGSLIRLGATVASGGATSYPQLGQTSVSVRGQTASGSGLTGYYLTYFRNSAAGFCPPASFNATNSWQITW